MIIRIGSFELNASRCSIFLGINLGRRWRYQTFRDWSGQGMSASDWIDRTLKSLTDDNSSNTEVG